MLREVNMPGQYPLFLNYQIPVACNGFWAGITMKGRVLLDESEGECWVFGVNPGGISASADNRESALSAYKTRLTEVVHDLAEVSKDFVEFKLEMEESFQVNPEYLNMWNEALKIVREGKSDLAGMTREPAETEASIRIDQIERPNPAMNSSEKITLARSKAA